jgi:hydroxymethylpyrimidine/phosphomethylpyrimidine kinase
MTVTGVESAISETDAAAERTGLWRSSEPKVALTVAGLDPSGGAGIIADLRTFDALGVYGMTVVTTLTVQNTAKMLRRHDVSPAIVGEQLEAIFADRRPNAVKVGALGERGMVDAVADVLKKEKFNGPLVLDPVIASSSGAPLLDDDGIEALVRTLVPLSTLVTPNMREVASLCGFDVFDMMDAEAAALRLVSLGANAALITGVKFTPPDGTPRAADIFCEGKDIEVFESPWTEDLDVHGTGCVLSAAAAAGLAKARGVRSAVLEARRFVRAAMDGAVKPGRGAPVANPFVGIEPGHEAFPPEGEEGRDR